MPFVTGAHRPYLLGLNRLGTVVAISPCMNTNMIDCPKCHTKIEINRAITAQLTEQIRVRLQADVDAQKAALDKEAESVAEQKSANEKAAAALEQKVKSGIEAGVTAARAALVADARRQATEDLEVELREKAERVSELERKLKASQDSELALRKREREFQDKSDNLDLEIARRLKEEAGLARQELLAEADVRKKVLDQQAQELERQKALLAESQSEIDQMS